MHKMNWDKLLSGQRERKSTVTQLPFRNAFDMDYERVIASSSVRRLQDKAQVFPLQENDFTRTRLTHSMEVSSIGRSIGMRIGHRLKEKGIFIGDQDRELSSLLAVSGLVHDLGNPPFGHYGENIVHEWFEKNRSMFKDDAWISDYLYFDGNAQTIRILSRLQFLRDRYGMNFSFGTLGTLLKYPWASSDPKAEKKQKIGYFITENDLIEKILNETGMKNQDGSVNRHPATFLLEAADDIAYMFADIEDTVKKGYLPWDEIKKELIKTSNKSIVFKGLPDTLKSSMKSSDINGVSIEDRKSNEVAVFRVFCQGVCIEQICDEFIRNHDSIMNGTYNQELLACTAVTEMVHAIKSISREYVYSSNEVLSLELIGKSVLSLLLDKFMMAALDEAHYLDTRTESGKLYHLISTNFKHIQRFKTDGNYDKDKLLDKHERVQLVIDFISGMTDSYALNLHKILLGTKLP